MSPIRKVAGLLDEARERGDMISFGGGAPSIPPPQAFLDESCRLLKEHPLRSSAYTGTRGLPQLREAVSEDVKKYGGVNYDPKSEIIVTSGATEAIYSATMSLIEEGDEVVVMDPTYLGYREMVEMAQGTLKWLRVSVGEGYQPSPERLKQLVSKKTKAFILLSPDNPTGRVIREDFVKSLVDLAEDFDFWIISDDIYKHIIYEGKHVWVARFPGAKERTVTICSFSKEAGVPGLRLGYTLAPAEIIDDMEKMQQYCTLAPESLGQFALVKFLNENMKEAYTHQSLLQYSKKRETMAECIAKYLPEAKTVKPQGAYYFFVDMRAYLTKRNMTEEEFSTRLLKETGVAVIPGGFFGENGKGHVRMTFVSESEERIEKGVQKISKFLSNAQHQAGQG